MKRLFKLGKLAKVAGGKGKLAAEILKSMGSEGLEEGTSEAANQIADALIMGDRSQMAEIYMAAKAAGKNRRKATAAALKGAAGQIGYSAGVGALSGGMIAGGVAGGSRLAGRNVLGEGTTESEQPLAEEEQTLQTEQNMPSAEQSTPITEQGTPAAEQTMPITEQTAPMIEQTAPTAEEQPTAEVQTAEQQTAERTVSPETQEAEKLYKGFAGIQREILRREGAGGYICRRRQRRATSTIRRHLTPITARGLQALRRTRFSRQHTQRRRTS